MTALPTRIRPLALHRSWIRLTRRADPARSAGGTAPEVAGRGVTGRRVTGRDVTELPGADERLATKAEIRKLRAGHLPLEPVKQPPQHRPCG